jgi:hypothetical protein
VPPEYVPYAATLRSLILADHPSTPIQNELDREVRVDRGSVLLCAIDQKLIPGPVAAVDRLIDLAPKAQQVRVVDSAGHARAAYRPMMIYAWIRALQSIGHLLPNNVASQWHFAIRDWCRIIENEMTWPRRSLLAVDGDQWAATAWSALTIHAAGEIICDSSNFKTADRIFKHFFDEQQPDGAFLAAAPADQPETRWYHELQILHALAGYMAYSLEPNLRCVKAVFKAGRFCQNQIQPDHATTQPWGLFAFIANPDTRPFADELLHAVQLNAGGAIDGLTSILLADCLVCLKVSKLSYLDLG